MKKDEKIWTRERINLEEFDRDNFAEMFEDETPKGTADILFFGAMATIDEQVQHYASSYAGILPKELIESSKMDTKPLFAKTPEEALSAAIQRAEL